MSEYLSQIVGVDTVQNIEKEFPRGKLIFGELVRKKASEFLVFFEAVPQCLHGKFIVLWYVDILDGLLFEEPLFFYEHLFEEVLVNLFERGQVILEVLVEIGVKVELRFQFPS